MSDPYLLPGGALRNVLGITDADDLLEREDKLSVLRLAEIDLGHGPKQTGRCLEDLKAIHRFIFKDIYPWAGKTRAEPFIDGAGGTKRIIETNFVSMKGRKVFANPRTIGQRLQALSETLHEANGFRGMKRRDFVVGIADFLAEINEVHAFREGNGRAQRAYVEQIAKTTGHLIEFRVITEERMVHASVAVDAGDPWPMRRLIRDASSPERVREMLKVKAFLTKVRLTDKSFDINKRYLGFVEPGRQHAAKIVGVVGRHFVCIENNASILVGWRKDLPNGENFPGQIVTFTGRGAPTNGVARRTPSLGR